MRYRAAAIRWWHEIAPDAPLMLDCELRGESMPPLGAAAA